MVPSKVKQWQLLTEHAEGRLLLLFAEIWGQFGVSFCSGFWIEMKLYSDESRLANVFLKLDQYNRLNSQQELL